MSQRKKILVIGASSFIGSHLLNYLKNYYRVIGTYFSTPVNIQGVTTYKLDLKDKIHLTQLIRFIKPDIVIYSVGLTGLEKCERNEAESDYLNTRAVFNVTNACEIYNSKFIYFSSAFVFSGNDYNYKVSDSPIPNTVFGNHKASTEFYIQKSYLNYVILRLPNIIGQSYSNSFTNDFEKLIYIKNHKEKILADDNIQMGFLPIGSLVLIVKKVIEQNLTNEVIHLSSQDVKTKHEFAQLFCNIFDYDISKLEIRSANFPEQSKVTFGIQTAGKYKFSLDLSATERKMSWRSKTIEENLVELKKSLVLHKKPSLKLI